MNQLEMTYANFIESVCKMYNVPDAAEPLVKGYKNHSGVRAVYSSVVISSSSPRSVVSV